MDTIEKYNQSIIELLTDYASHPVSNPGVEKQLIVDKERHRYQVIVCGWEKGKKYVNSTLLHLEIKNGKIWIQQNWTEIAIAKKLVAQGILPSNIVLGFLPEYMRADSAYGVA